MTKTASECLSNKTWINLYIGAIPLIFFVLSTIIILLQQRGYRRVGYFMIILAPISSFYLFYFQTEWNIWSNIVDVISSTPLLFLVCECILLLASLIPFYVLGRLIKEDLLKK
jgi:hypothetical protein